MTARVHSIGLATPKAVLTQAEAIALAQRSGASASPERIERIFRGSGVSQRAIALHGMGDPIFTDNPSTGERMQRYAEHAPPLAREACNRSLARAGLDPSAITHVVTASCTGFVAPGIDHALIESLGLSRDVARTHVGYMGCHGAINALAVASAIAEADPQAIVLVCCVELCSLHYHSAPTDEQLVANALFGDGAAACIVSQRDPKERARGWRIAVRSSRVVESTSELMGWAIGDHGFVMRLSPRVPRVLRESVADWTNELANRAGREPGELVGWAVHPGGPSIVDAVGESLGLADARLAASRAVLDRHGNMSSPTVLFVLEEVAATQGVVDTAMLAFGPGVSCEGLVLLA